MADGLSWNTVCSYSPYFLCQLHVNQYSDIKSQALLVFVLQRHTIKLDKLMFQPRNL